MITIDWALVGKYADQRATSCDRWGSSAGALSTLYGIAIHFVPVCPCCMPMTIKKYIHFLIFINNYYLQFVLIQFCGYTIECGHRMWT